MFGILEMIVMAGSVVCIGLVIGLFLIVCFKKVPSNMAGIRTGFGGIKVTKSGMICLPILHRFDLMDLSIQEIKIELKGKNGAQCKDNIRADIEASFYVMVNPDEPSIIEVAASVGCACASEAETLKGLFEAKFSDVLQAVASQYDNEELRRIRTEFRNGIFEEIGHDLNGYRLEDVAINYLEQTPRENHDPNNTMDAKGIEKIARLTAQSQKSTDEIIQKMEVERREQAVATEMEKLELARQKEVALAKMQRELEGALKETFPDKNKIEELRSQITKLEEQDSPES